ncbi:hypothetical protein C0J52_23754, partial [Blattella germanica]
PSSRTIRTWVDNLETTDSTLKKKPPGRRKSVRTPETIEVVRTSFLRNHSDLHGDKLVLLELSRRALSRILFHDLKLHPYKIQVVLELKTCDLNSRVIFANQFLAKMNEISENSDF